MCVRITFFLYWIFLTVLLLVWNPFAVVPIDEELVEEGFGVGLDPHTLTFLILAVLGLASRFRHAVWLWFGMLVYAGATEWVQGWTGRCPDWADFAHNVAGLVFGTLGWLSVVGLRRVGRRREKSGTEKGVGG